MNKDVKIKVKKVNDELNLRIKILLASESLANHKTAMRLAGLWLTYNVPTLCNMLIQ